MSFKIISILVVKNEVDIVGDVIKEASKWSDKIIVLDNHSNDGTWELINSLKMIMKNNYMGTISW